MVRELLQPSPIRIFKLKALRIFVLWYILYELWLLPDGQLDYWVALSFSTLRMIIPPTLLFIWLYFYCGCYGCK